MTKLKKKKNIVFMFWWKFFLKKSYFLSKFVIFNQTFQNMRSLGDKLLIFDQKLKNIWGLWVTGHNIRCLWVMSELRKGILRALHSVPLHMGVPESPTLQNKLSMLRKYGAFDLDKGCSCDRERPNDVSSPQWLSGPVHVVEFGGLTHCKVYFGNFYMHIKEY